MFTVKYFTKSFENGPIESALLFTAHSVRLDAEEGYILYLLDERDNVIRTLNLPNNTYTEVYIENMQGKNVQKFASTWVHEGK
jgi:hypothetical protein